MPVAGFPAAVEVLLSSLLTSDELSSWKVTGEPGGVVVVLRFRPSDGQPLLASHTQRGHWRRKPPAQLRRDQLRAQRHRTLGETAHFLNFAKHDDKITANNICDQMSDASRSPRASTSSPCPTMTLTFDPPSQTTIVAKKAVLSEEIDESVMQTDSSPDDASTSATVSKGHPSEEDEWMRAFDARFEAAHAAGIECWRQERKKTDTGGGNTGATSTMDPGEDTEETPPLAECSPAMVPSVDNSTSKPATSTRQTRPPSSAEFPTTTAASLRGTQQLTARQDSSNSVSCNTGSTRVTRSRPSTNPARNAQTARKPETFRTFARRK